MSGRDMDILRHIWRYCGEVTLAVERFGDDRAAFDADPVYRNAVAMPVQQIGELAKRLTDGFQERYTEIPWKAIKGMRTWFAHQYAAMDRDVIWEVVHEGIPPLKAFCEHWLESQSLES